jgi:hypothetical protein
MFMICDHCGKDTGIHLADSRLSWVAWCKDCMVSHYHLLNVAFGDYKFHSGWGRVYWSNQLSIETVKSIPKKINNPDNKCSGCSLVMPHTKNTLCVSCLFLQQLEGSV